MAKGMGYNGHVVWLSATSMDGNPDGLFHWSVTLSFSAAGGGFGFVTVSGLIFPREGATEGDVLDDLHLLVVQRAGGKPGTHALINYRCVPNRPLR